MVAIGDNRGYDSKLEDGQTVQPQPYSLVGDGAGSVFKIFTAAAVVPRHGHGHQRNPRCTAVLPGSHLGDSTPGLPRKPGVKNAAGYRTSDEHDRRAGAVAEHRLRQAHPAGRRWPNGGYGGPAGTALYAEPGTAHDYVKSDESLADYIKRENIGSFTLGPFEVNALELSNVAATPASGGTWCPPSPIEKVFDRNSGTSPFRRRSASRSSRRVWPTRCPMRSPRTPMGNGRRGRRVGGLGPADVGKTGTTESHRSSAFVGYTNQLAAASYVLTTPQAGSAVRLPVAQVRRLRKPLRRHLAGPDLVPGDEPDSHHLGPVGSCPLIRAPVGAPPTPIPDITGLKLDAAKQRLKDAGFQGPICRRRSTARPAGTRWSAPRPPVRPRPDR